MIARLRKALGCLVLLAYVTIYAAATATLGAVITAHATQWLTLLYFAIAGVAWVIPLKPLFAWMNRGA